MSKKFKKIQDWVNSKGYSIKYGKTDTVDFDERVMTLNNSQYETNLIYTALHECGHILIERDSAYKTRYKSIHKADECDGRHYRSNIYKYKKIQEEIEAWEKGFKLSKKLGININKDKYDVYASKYVLGYCKTL